MEEIEKHSKSFYIRANRCSSIYNDTFALKGWKTEEINGIEFELNSILVEKWKGKAYRLVIQRQKRMDGVQDFWEGEYTYRCILTNDYDSSVRDSVMRGYVNATRTFKGLVADLRLKPLRQTYGYFTAPIESFEHGAKTGHIRIGDNPINAYCFGNAILDFDNLENCKPIKIRQTQKIDGVITVLMCVRQFIDYER